MRPITKALCLCLSVLLLVFGLAACRNKDFKPAIPPPDEGDKNGDLPAEDTVEVYAALRKMSRSSKTVDAFPQKENSLRFVFCTGGTAPETTVPAYQLPNATLYGVYTLFPDDTGWYGDDLITAHVHSFRLKEGSFASLLALADPS